MICRTKNNFLYKVFDIYCTACSISKYKQISLNHVHSFNKISIINTQQNTNLTWKMTQIPSERHEVITHKQSNEKKVKTNAMFCLLNSERF